MIASGWGKTNGTDNGSSAKTLQTVELDVISNNDCQKMDRRITKTQVCANTPKKSVCQGDSGGSIDKVSNELSYAFGVVSYGPQNCDGYGVFTRVSEYITWIEQRTGETFCKP
ncbi:unnamed protein product [Allacma fusca]|uniref:Peptidase S1 domain-containing protein n=1 Tax=Allacma fusca TaxID=39272 RepID=A0A8J2JT15_9HEXA|nr:unnamed protein product [Allacma fusca]